MDEVRGRVFWHKNLQDVPIFPEGAIGTIIERLKNVKFTTSRAYKFFLEGFIHEVEGERKADPLPLSSLFGIIIMGLVLSVV